MSGERKVCVLHVVAGNLYGGIETMLVTMARYRHTCPHLEPSFAVCVEGRLSEELRAAGVPVHVLGMARASRPWTVWAVRRAMRSLLRAGRYDTAISHGPWAHAVFGGAIRRAGVPAVLWLHAPPEGEHWVERWAKRCVPDLVIANSRYTQAALPDFLPNVPQRRITYPVAPPLISDLARTRHEVRTALNTPQEQVVILMAARMEAWKGHHMLLEGLSRVMDLPGWTCWIAGGAQRPAESRYLEELQTHAKSLKLESQVRFLGQRADVPRLMASADIYCQPNQAPEPFGIVFVEALYAGLPVVAVNAGGAAEIVDGTCGRLVAPGDAKGLARDLRGLLECPDLRRDLGATGPSRAKSLCDPKLRLAELFTIMASWRGAASHA